MARIKASTTTVSYADTTIAVIGSVEYETLQAAIDAATESQQIQLIKSTTESVTIAEDKNITLNIAEGVTLTNIEGLHTITNNGTLTITGTGTIDNISHEKCALWNNGTATLTGNTYNRSQESGSSATESGANSYYTIVNHGTMIINDETTVTQNGKFSSLLENGWYNGNENTSGKNSVLTIEGGTFTGGLNTIKNDDYGVLTINDGTFTNVAQTSLMNWNTATVNGGEFTVDTGSNSVIINGYLNNTMDKGELNINGGIFGSGNIVTRSTPDSLSVHSSGTNAGTITITNGELNGNINLDYGTTAGGSLTISDTATINGSVISTKADSVTISGGTISNGISNIGTGTVNITGGTVKNSVKNTSTGTVTISGGTFVDVPKEEIENFIVPGTETIIQTYTVTVVNGTGSGEYEENASVTCFATIPEGKEFDVWVVEGITGVVLGNSTLTFRMPANVVTCTATFKDVTPKPEPQPTLKNSWYYTVEECGITLAGLAKRFNIDIKKLMKDNSITELRPLYKGEQILIVDDGTEEIAPPIDYWF